MPTGKGIGRKWFRKLGLVCFFGVVFFIIFMGSKGISQAFPSLRLMIVLSGSMRPAFDTGALIAVETIETDHVRVGDVVTFREPGGTDKLITHRVVAIRQDKGQDFFTTKGDANEQPDAVLVPEENILGKVVGAIPLLGFLVSFLQSEAGLTILVGMCFVLAALVVLTHLTQGAKAN